MPSVSRHGLQRRLLLLAMCAAFATIYASLAIRTYCAQRLADRSDQPSLIKAITLAPRNATYHDLLCRNMIYASQDPRRAVKECVEASRLNANSSFIWLDLAQAYYSVGNVALTNAAVHKALSVDPTTPDTVWSAANFYLMQGNTPEALRLFAIVLREEPSLTLATLSVCWQSLHDVDRIRSILPPRPEAYLAFINILLSSGDLETASQIWSLLIQLKVSFDFHQGMAYIDTLLQAGATTQAHDAWIQLSSVSKPLQAYSEPGNLIMDPSFTQEILNSGFDWRYTPRQQIAVSLDKSEFHTGNRSLKVLYSDSGGDAGIVQYIAVQPAARYRLSAWVRSDDLDTANGPALALLDGNSNTVYGSTEETSGTTAWHQVHTELQTGSEATLLILSIMRRPGETHIHGTFWIDDIRMEPLSGKVH